MKVKVNIDGIEQEVEMDDLAKFTGNGITLEKNQSNKKHKKINDIKGRIVGATPLIVVALYLLIGFTKGIWHPTWLLFALIPIVPLILFGFNNGKSSFMGIIAILVIFGYFVLGSCGYWHPGWLIFFLIPIYSILFSAD